jgi:DNA-binding NarL/FixJ family response regulator
MPQKFRTVIIEDETMFRQLLLSTLRRARNLHVIGAFECGRPGLNFCLQEKPELAVVDLVLPDMKGMDIVRTLRSTLPELRILILTAHPSAQLPGELVTLGVHGYVDKAEPLEYVLKAIETVRHGGMFFASHVQAKASSRTSAVPALKSPLTKREEQVVRLVAEGQMSKEIALRLQLSLRTVEKHRENIMQKVGVRKVASLTRWCIESGLIEE